MKKGDRVLILKDAKYEGQFMSWTERQTDSVILKAGTKLYHSSDKKLKEFKIKETCFYYNTTAPGYTYCLVLDKDTKAKVFDNEIRIELTENLGSMYYIGEKVYDYERSYNSNIVYYKDNYIKKYAPKNVYIEDIIVS